LIPRAPASSARELRHVARPRLDPAERDQQAGRLRRLRDHGVVLLAVCAQILLAEREHERVLNPEPARLAGQQRGIQHRAVVVLAEVRVHVPDGLAGGKQRRDQLSVAAVDQGGSGRDRVGHQ
jgi:hypothetical protein